MKANKNKQNLSNIKPKESKKIPKVIGLGIINLDFYININEALNKNIKIDLEKIKSPKDLEFIINDQVLLDLIQISTTDTLTNILLYLNRTNILKCFVELITINPLRFKPEEEFIRKIFSHVTEHNYLFTNEMSVSSYPNKISFSFKSGKKILKYWLITSDYDPLVEEIKKDEKQFNVGEKSINNNINKNIIANSNKFFINKDNSEIKEVEEFENNNNYIKINNENNFDDFTNNEPSRDINYNINENSKTFNEDKDLRDEMMNEQYKLENPDSSTGNQGVERNQENSLLANELNSYKENSNSGENINNNAKIIKDYNNQDHEGILNNYDNIINEKLNVEFKPDDSQDEANFEIQKKHSSANVTDDANANLNISSLEKEKISVINKCNENPSKHIKQNQANENGYKKNNSNTLELSPYQSNFKLFNIPAACEIEEYDFLFIDLDQFLQFHECDFHLIELSDFIKKIALENKSPRIVVNFPNILLNINIMNLELIEVIMSIMSHTDIFLFDKKECLAFFNMLSQMNTDSELTEKNLFNHFYKEIPHIKNGVSKIGLFMDEFQKFTIIEHKGNKTLNKNDYYLNLYPKINHTNQKVIDEYRKIMLLNNNYFKSTFYGGYFSKYIFLDEHYPAFLGGLESTKRILELFKNKIDFPTDPEFYIVKLQKAKIHKDLVLENLRKKEDKFVLDCMNKKSSSLKDYNPLFDEHLNAFFSSSIVQKQLKEKGFINTNGFVLYDPSYNNTSPKNAKKKRISTPEKEKNLLYAIKNNKDIFSNDVESLTKANKELPTTTRRLPNAILLVKDTSNIYTSKKHSLMKKSSKRQLRPIYHSVSKLDKEEKSRDTSVNPSIGAKKGNVLITSIEGISNSQNKKEKINAVQNFHNLDKNHINDALNSSGFVEEKIIKSKNDYSLNNNKDKNNIIIEMTMKQNKSENIDKNLNFNNANNEMDNLVRDYNANKSKGIREEELEENDKDEKDAENPELDDKDKIGEQTNENNPSILQGTKIIDEEDFNKEQLEEKNE